MRPVPSSPHRKQAGPSTARRVKAFRSGDWRQQARPTAHPPPPLAAVARALLTWFARNARDLPWRHKRDPYAVWVSEIMLQQTQVATVIPYWQRWMRELPTIEAVAKARPEKLRKLWEGLGYYRRVHHLQQAARTIVRHHGGQIPETFDALLALPGVGRYTAGAIASIAFNQPRPVLDGNVLRVLTRLVALRADPRRSATRAYLWRLAEALVLAASQLSRRHLRFPSPTSHGARMATGSCSMLNQSLMELGAVLCTPRQPRCDVCPLARQCAAHRLGLAAQLPAGRKASRPEERLMAAFWVHRRGRILVRQRPGDGLNAHLWELPNMAWNGSRRQLARRARQILGIAPTSTRPLCSLTHSITRYRMRIELFPGDLLRPVPGARWLTRAQLDQRPFTGLDRKLLQQLRPA